MALLHVDFYSPVLMMEMQMDVILPEATKGQIGMEGRSGGDKWKTLYLLHGMSDDHTIWQRRTSIERYAADKGIAVVMPTTHLGWYTDMYRGLKYFTFISDELPKVCRQMFPNLSVKLAEAPKAKSNALSYDLMLKYIVRMPNARDLLKEYENVRLMSKCQKSPYKYVCKWFEVKFPNYGKMLNFDEKGELIWKKEEDDKANRIEKTMELFKAANY